MAVKRDTTGSIGDPKVRRRIRQAGISDPAKANRIMEILRATIEDISDEDMRFARDLIRYQLAETMPRTKIIEGIEFEGAMSAPLVAFCMAIVHADTMREIIMAQYT